MGRHAAPRKPSSAALYARRAAAISGGTLALCIGAAAPVLADTSPVPLPQPVSDAVQQVSNAAGVPNPVGASTPNRHHKDPVKHPDRARVPSSSPAGSSSTTATASSGAVHLRVAPAVLVQHRPRHPIRLAAVTSGGDVAASPVPSSSVLGQLPADPLDNSTVRVIAVAAAMMLLGGLTAGHLRNTQRLLTVPYAE